MHKEMERIIEIIQRLPTRPPVDAPLEEQMSIVLMLTGAFGLEKAADYLRSQMFKDGTWHLPQAS
jgi:hypothetical protein